MSPRKLNVRRVVKIERASLLDRVRVVAFFWWLAAGLYLLPRAQREKIRGQLIASISHDAQVQRFRAKWAARRAKRKRA